MGQTNEWNAVRGSRGEIMTQTKELSSIKDKIYELRCKWKMSQVEFGEKIGVDGSTVGRWEKGDFVPSNINIYKMAKAFGVSPAWFLEEAEPDRKEEKVYTKDEIIQQCKPAIDEANPVGALFFLLGRYIKIDDVEDNNGETQIIATIKGEVANVIKGMMYIHKGIESGYLDQEMMSIWKEKKLKEYGVEEQK